jgi:hypothetical protein
MKYIIFILAILPLQDISYKPNEEFEVKLDYAFKPRPPADHNTVRLGESVKDYQHRSGTSVLPYLILNVNVLYLQEEKMRVRVTTNLDGRGAYKKVDVGDVVELDLGFTDDMKDRVSAHQYNVTFYDDDKNPVDNIVISVGEDGAFFVNGEKRGKF